MFLTFGIRKEEKYFVNLQIIWDVGFCFGTSLKSIIYLILSKI